MTTPTLRDLFDAIGEGDDAADAAYDTARAKAVADIADYIRPHLKEADIAEALAGEIMANAEERGDLDGNAVHGEVASRFTRSGNPLPF